MNQNDHPSFYRIEKDSLGEVKVPMDALFGAQTQRAVENFPISGLRPYKVFIWSMGAIKTAAATVHAELGLLKPDFSQELSGRGMKSWQENGMINLWSIHFRQVPERVTT